MRIESMHLELRPPKLRQFFAAAVSTWLFLVGPYGVPSALAGLPEFQIGVLAIEPQSDWSEKEWVVADVTNDLLPSIIEKVFSGRFQQYVWAERFDISLPQQPNVRVKTLHDLKARGVTLLLVPELDFNTRGLAVRTTVYDFRFISKIDSNMRGVRAAAFMSPEADFGQIEQKLYDLADGLAERISAGRTSPRTLESPVHLRASVVVGCILPADREDKELVAASRRLTLELPYFLTKTESSGEIEYRYVGLSSKDFFAECVSRRTAFATDSTRIQAQPQPSRLREEYDFELSGQVDRSERGDYEITVYVDSRNRKFAVPLPAIGISSPIEERALFVIARQLANELQTVAAK